jgi:hypothetical protein
MHFQRSRKRRYGHRPSHRLAPRGYFHVPNKRDVARVNPTDEHLCQHRQFTINYTVSATTTRLAKFYHACVPGYWTNHPTWGLVVH